MRTFSMLNSEILGIILSSASITLMTIISVGFLLGLKGLWLKTWHSALFLSIIIYHSYPFFEALAPDWVIIPRLVTTLVPSLFFILAKHIFEDDAKNFLTDYLIALTMAMLSIVTFIIDTKLDAASHELIVRFRFFSLTTLSLFIGFTIYTVAKGWKSDLIELRVKLRAFIISTMGFVIIMVMVFEGFLPENRGFNSTFNVVVAIATIITTSSIIAILMSRSIYQLMPSETKRKSDSHKSDQDEQENAIVEKVVIAMQNDRLYLNELLTLQSLSEYIDEPAYKVRNIINQRMGYRNFNVFANYYRIEAAKKMLSHEDFDDHKILAIALDVGYSSLSPFNRAFKNATNMTPSEYRKYAKQKNSETALGA